MENETISITFNGEISLDNDVWMEWYNDSKNLIRLLGYEPSHVGILSSSLKSGKVLTLKRSERKVIDSIKKNDVVECVALYSLPDPYNNATFDYNVFVGRDNGFLTIIMNKRDYNDKIKECIINTLSKYISSKLYEIYEMDRSECPVLYAAKDNPMTSYKTLKIIEKGNV